MESCFHPDDTPGMMIKVMPGATLSRMNDYIGDNPLASERPGGANAWIIFFRFDACYSEDGVTEAA